MKTNTKTRPESKYPGTRGPLKDKVGSVKRNPDPNGVNRDEKVIGDEQDIEGKERNNVNEVEQVMQK